MLSTPSLFTDLVAMAPMEAFWANTNAGAQVPAGPADEFIDVADRTRLLRLTKRMSRQAVSSNRGHAGMPADTRHDRVHRLIETQALRLRGMPCSSPAIDVQLHHHGTSAGRRQCSICMTQASSKLRPNGGRPRDRTRIPAWRVGESATIGSILHVPAKPPTRPNGPSRLLVTGIAAAVWTAGRPAWPRMSSQHRFEAPTAHHTARSACCGIPATIGIPLGRRNTAIASAQTPQGYP